MPANSCPIEILSKSDSWNCITIGHDVKQIKASLSLRIDPMKPLEPLPTLFCWQPTAVFFSHIKSAPATSHQPASGTFLSQQISTSHHPQPAEQCYTNKDMTLIISQLFLQNIICDPSSTIKRLKFKIE